MISPIQHIPDELLNEIFTRCLPDEPWQITLSPKEAPLLLTHVCSHWRRVAIESNEHWNWLKFHPNSVGATSSWQFRPLTEALGRAKGGSLNLQIKVPLFDHAMPPIIDSLVVPFSRSLTRLTIHDAPVRQLSRLPLGLFPKLERLALRFQLEPRFTSHFVPNEDSRIKAFRDAPALRCVALASGLESGGVAVSLPYPQLTHLMYTGNEGTFRNFLIQGFPSCKELRWLALDLTENDLSLGNSKIWDRIPSRSMTNIESLSLNFWGAGAGSIKYPNFFSKTHFPNLRAFRVEGGSMGGNHLHVWPAPLPASFLHKLEQFTRLEYLSICHESASHSILQQTFRVTPCVTTLDFEISGDFEFENIFAVLTLGPDIFTHLLPHLQTLILEVSSSSSWELGTDEAIDPSTFCPFLESRLRPSAATRTLQKIIIYNVEDEQMADERPFIQIIQGYVSQGLLELERRNVRKQRGSKYNAFWMERDAWLSDWAEASLVI